MNKKTKLLPKFLVLVVTSPGAKQFMADTDFYTRKSARHWCRQYADHNPVHLLLIQSPDGKAEEYAPRVA